MKTLRETFEEFMQGGVFAGFPLTPYEGPHIGRVYHEGATQMMYQAYLAGAKASTA